MTTGTEFSVMALITNASFGVQCVIFILFVFSLYSWAIIFSKVKLITSLQSTLKEFESVFWKDNLKIFSKTSKKKDIKGIEIIFMKGLNIYSEINSKISGNKKTNSIVDSTKNKRMVGIIQSTFEGEIAMQEQIILKDLAILATISSTAPYIGLFGTVWGILIAFWGFATETNVTIAVIAPHISEALIATGMGLLVAIPAQIAYNKFNIISGELVDRYKNITHKTINLINKDLLINDFSEEDEE